MTVLSSEHTVESVIHLYKNNIRTSFDEKIVTLEGFYLRENKPQYRHGYYDKLCNEQKTHSITIIIKPNLRERLIPGQYYRFHGFVNRGNQQLKNGAIQLIYWVTKVIDHIDDYHFISKTEFNLVRKRFDKDSVDIQGHLLKIIRQGNQPNIHVILGSTSIVDEDYKDQLQQDHIFNITEERINFSNSSLIVNTLSSYEKSAIDLIVCMRGGGLGLDIFNDTNLAEKVVQFKLPFVTALGHKSDLTLVERMADRGFATPTAFGSFLNSIQQQYEQEIQELKSRDTSINNLNKKIQSLEESQQKLELRHENDKQQLEKLYSEQRLRDKNLIRKLIIAIILMAVFILLGIYLLAS
ncbi:putative Exonuclease VII large subunit [Tenacibaculum sp. 190524A02b]|uniref:exodeoxyribonuclease VII large subunit n=1 Tax=Tenacibaculum vairaonense TaxID=3137860 RepID=UPI0032B25C4A